MKTCSKCNELKPLSDFGKRRKGTQAYCKDCNKEYKRRHYQSNASLYKKKSRDYKIDLNNQIQKLKEVPCADCGKQYHFCAMDFDHLENKEFGISQATTLGKSLPKIMNEIAKCEVVCAVCHRIRSFKRQSQRP